MILVRDVAWFAILVASFTLVGHLLLWRILNRRVGPLAYLWLCITSGSLVTTGAVFALGCFHLFSGWSVAGLLLTLWAAALYFHFSGSNVFVNLLTELKSAHHAFRIAFSEMRAGAITVLIIAALAFCGCLTPEVRGDPIIYHITEAWLFVVAKGHVEIPSSVLTYIPQNQQLLYALGLCLGSDSLAKLLHWLPGVMLLVGGGSFAVRLGLAPRGAVVSALLVACCPIWFYLATTTYIDLAVGNYLLASLYLLLLALEQLQANGEGEWLATTAWAGAFCGGALGCKYTAVLVGFAPAVLAALGGAARCKLSWGSRLKLMFTYSGVAFVVFAPWLVRNWLWTGNPIAPSFMRILGPAEVPEATLSWPDIQAKPPLPVNGLFPLLRAYATMAASLSDYGNLLPSLAAILGLGTLLLPRSRRAPFFPWQVQFLLGFVVLSLVLGVPTAALRRDSRYIMAHVTILAGVIVWWYQQYVVVLARKHELLRQCAAACVVLLVVSGAVRTVLWFQDLNETIVPIADASERERYCAQRLPNYRANKNLGRLLTSHDGKVLGAAYPAPVHYVLGGMPLKKELLIQNSAYLKPEDLAGLQRCGVKYLFGEISQELRPYVEYLGESENVPLWRIVAQEPQTNL
jgi:hypothetical protein